MKRLALKTAIRADMANELELLSGMDPSRRGELAALLKQLAHCIEGPGG